MRRRLLAVIAFVSLLLPPLTAGPQTFGADQRGRLQAFVDEWRKAASFPGISVGVVLADGSATTVVSGVSDRASGTPITDRDLLLAGSTGKTFVAAVALQLIEAGSLDPDALVSRYLGDRPWFARLPNASSITVRHLMTHSSGLVRYEMNPQFTAALRAAPDRVWAPEEQLAYLFDRPAPFAAGQGWGYADTNYIVLGMILEQVTRKTLYDEIQRRFLGPLGLDAIVPSTSRKIAGLIPGYAGPRDPLGLPDEVMADGVLAINPQFEWAGGGFATRPIDLAKWGRALYAGPALSARARQFMFDAAVPAALGSEARYGPGVIIRSAPPLGVTWGHSGFFPGYQTELVHVVTSGVTVAVQVNSSAPRSTGPRSLLRGAMEIAEISASPRGRE